MLQPSCCRNMKRTCQLSRSTSRRSWRVLRSAHPSSPPKDTDMRHTPAAAWVAATAATALLVTGCGSSDDGTPSKKAAAPKADGQDINAHPLSDIRQGGQLKVPITQWITQYNYNTVDGAQG